MTEGLAHSGMMSCIRDRNNVFDILWKGLVEGAFYESLSARFTKVAVDVFPTGAAAKRELVRGNPYNWTVLFVKLFNLPKIIATEPLLHRPKRRDGRLSGTWKFC